MAEFPGYEVSDAGRVRSWRISRSTRRRDIPLVLKFRPSRSGYLYVQLPVGGGKFLNQAVHRLVAEAFNGPCVESMQVNHVNGDKHDNRPANLEYVTPSQNIRHAFERGLIVRPKGMASNHAKLTDDSVRRIVALSSSGLSNRKVASLIGVGSTTVQGVLSGKSWTHVTGKGVAVA